MEISQPLQNLNDREKARVTRSNSMASIQIGKETLMMAIPVAIRGRRLRQILRVLPIDVMEVQMLAREFFSRCDLQEAYMSLDKCADSFGITAKIAKGIYAYIRMNEALDDIPFNHARKLELLFPGSGRSSVIADLQEWKRQQSPPHRSEAVAKLPALFLTFENFVEASVYVSPRGSIQQRIDMAFSILDTDCNGVVDAQEIRNIMLDSLMANLKGSHKGECSRKVVEILENEVQELLNDLRTQYQTDEFTKEQFIEFAESAEFLNFFTVNKHWLRDILGDVNYNKQARPQDAEMRQFLESLREEESCDLLDSEDIVQLQETLRDHLVDTVDDLRSLKLRDFGKMNIDRSSARAIMSRLKTLSAELDDNDFMRIPSALPGASRQSTTSSLHATVAMEQSLCSRLSVATAFPSNLTIIRSGFLSLYIVQMVIAYSVLGRNRDALDVLGSASSYGIFLCIFMAPLSGYYELLTKWMSIAPDTFRGDIVLFVASPQCVRLNAYIAIAHTAVHSLSFQIRKGMASDTLCLQGVTGWVLVVLGIVSLLDWWRVTNPHALVHCVKCIVLRLAVVIVLASHSAVDLSFSASIAFARTLPLLVSLLPTMVLIGGVVHQRMRAINRMEVELVKNERPNYVLLWIKRGHFRHRCGQYVQLNCPAVSRHEYHPFYITSSPDANYLRISMLGSGDWTQRMFELHLSREMELSEINVLGPFGVGFPSTKMHYNYDYLMVIAAGEGSVEVISSMLDFCCSNFLTNKAHPVQIIYCYWMVSADDGCYWFYKLLRDLRHIYKDKFFPTILVTSSDHTEVSNFGLNFFLALRRESLQQNAIARKMSLEKRLSSERLCTFRTRKKSIFYPMRNGIRRASRFHSGTNNLLIDQDDDCCPSSHLLSSFERKTSSRDKSGRHKKHDFNLKFEAQVGEDSDDIVMQSPDFRNTFSKLREQLINTNESSSGVSSPGMGAYAVQSNYNIAKQTSMNSIVPALVPSNSGGRQYNVGVYFVGSDILATRLRMLCEQFTDNRVCFEFNPMVVGSNYTNKFG